MFPLKSILHPTDFSANSAPAFEVARTLARDYGARLLVLYVEPPPVVLGSEDLAALAPEPAEIQRIKDNLFRPMQPLDPAGVVEHHLKEGDPATAILRLARERGVGLIVMGTHGRRGLSRLVMGSVAEEVLRKAPCPVLTVKPPPAGSVVHADEHETVASV